MADTPPIDVNWLRKTFEDDAVLAELYSMYLGDTAKRIEELRAALAAADALRCSRIAHAMKGSSGNVGANGMREIAARLEKHDSGADLAGAQALASALESEFGRVERFIKDFLATCTCPSA